MSDFDGVPLAVGSVRGVRHFNVSDEPALFGPVTNTPFLPGVNTAEHSGFSKMSAMLTNGPAVAVPTQFRTHDGIPDHPVAGMSCRCGFYAYYAISFSSYSHTHRVAAVIEGFGRVTLGTLGFRCEKARLLAISLGPALHQLRDDNPSSFDIALGRFKDFYPGVRVFGTEAEMLAEFPLDVPEEVRENVIRRLLEIEKDRVRAEIVRATAKKVAEAARKKSQGNRAVTPPAPPVRVLPPPPKHTDGFRPVRWFEKSRWRRKR